MNKISVLSFDNYREYLGYISSSVSRLDRGTLEVWARRLGYKSPSSLSMVLSGQRIPSQDLITAISNDLKFSNKEALYFQLLVQLEKEKRKNKDFSRTLESLQKIKKYKTFANIDLESFRYIAEWKFLAIKNLIYLADFKEDYQWMSRRLRGKVSAYQAKEGIEVLVSRGILVRGEDGELKIPDKGLATPNDIPSAAIKSHHREMMLRATESLDEVSIGGRQISSFTLAFRQNDIEKAKSRIVDFMNSFNEEFSSDYRADDVYQLGIQFFPHTDGKYEDINERNEENEGRQKITRDLK